MFFVDDRIFVSLAEKEDEVARTGEGKGLADGERPVRDYVELFIPFFTGTACGDHLEEFGGILSPGILVGKNDDVRILGGDPALFGAFLRVPLAP